MTIDVSDFKGEAPRLAPRSLPNQMGQNSENARLLSGDVDAWYGFSESTAQPIVVDPLTIYYLAEEVWLTFNTAQVSPSGNVSKLWEEALGTPFWDGTGHAGTGTVTYNGATTNLFPCIVGMDGSSIRIIDYAILQAFSAAAFNSPGLPPIGDNLTWAVAQSTGTIVTSRSQTASEALLWPAMYHAASQSVGYPGPGNAVHNPYAQFTVAWLTNGNNVVAGDNVEAISGGSQVSNATNGVGAQVFVVDPYTCLAVYDIIPVLSNILATSYVGPVWPCADGVHIVVLTGTAAHAGTPDQWHIVQCGSAGAVEVAYGPWTAGPDLLGESVAGVGNANYCANYFSSVDSTTVGCLESDLEHLWILSGDRALVCLALSNGNNYTTVYNGANGTALATVPASDLISLSIFADQGQCAVLQGNVMALWSRPVVWQANAITATEADIEKAAISGDVSFRTYFCGTDAPRFTDIGLASGLTAGGNPVTGSASLGSGFPGNGPFPIYSRKIGVPTPTFVPTVTLAQASAGSTISTLVENFVNPVQWTLSTATLQNSDFASVGGYPNGDALHLQSIGGEAYGYKNFAVDPTQAVTMEVEFALSFAANCYQGQGYLDFYVGMDASGQGTCIRVYINSVSSAVAGSNNVLIEFCPVTGFVIGAALSTTAIASGSIPTWNGSGYYVGPFQGSLYNQAVITIGAPSAAGVSAMSITIKTVNGAGNFVTATGLTASYASCPNNGSTYGVQAFTAPGNSIPYWLSVNYANFTIIGTTPLTAAAAEATAYVYTLLNDLGEESGPSPASAVITRNLGYGVEVGLPPSLGQAGVDPSYFYAGAVGYVPAVQNAVSFNPGGPSPGINLYRLVTNSSGGTQFLLVASDLPMGDTYLDVIPDSSLSEVIPSYFTLNGVIGTWDVPPTNMLGILALPNGIYAGFFGNTLCLSAQGIPHAWVLIFQQTVDYPIVGIAAMDAAVIVCSEKYPYVFYGQTPDAYSATKGSYPHACAAKKSIANVKGVGVVYATFEGLVAISGPGKEVMLTEQLFTKREWQALNPSSMIAVVNDNRYFCFYAAGGYAGGFYIDMDSQKSAGKVSLGFHAYTRFNDPLSDNLYLVLDEDYLGLDISLNTIVTFDSDTLNPLPFVWKSKQFYVDHPLAYSQCRVKSESYANTTITLFADGQAYATLPVTSGNEFAIPRPPNGVLFQYFEFQIQGTDRVNRVQFVEDGQEWT